MPHSKRSRYAIVAPLVAADDLDDVAIAKRAGISVPTLTRWKRDPAFQALVAHERETIQRAMLRHEIAKKHRRLHYLNELHQRLWQVIEERARYYQDLAERQRHDPVTAAASRMFVSTEETRCPPGGETGLVIRQVRAVGSGRSTQIVEEYVVDAATIREIRALQEQAARELGQWIERQEQTGEVTVFRLVGVPVEAI